MEFIMKAVFEFKSASQNNQVEIDLDFVLSVHKEVEVQLTNQLRVKSIELKEVDLSNSFPIFRYKCQQVKKPLPIKPML